ncbi:MAG: GIDE domain-containing protein [bacterium]|nr:GIDE domain-containing protein [bacterium]
MKSNADTIKAILILAIFSGAGIWLFFDGFRKWRRKRLIENIPTSKIRSMAMGLVELQGKATPWLYTLKGPISGRDCVFYKFLVERYERHGKNSSWVKVANGASNDNLFHLDDGTGKVLINPRRAEINLDQPDFSFESGLFGGDIPSNLVNFLEQNNIRYQTWFGKQRMRFREWNICPNDQVYVLGSVARNENFVSDFKIKLNERLREIKAKPEEMMKFDRDGDGTISVYEWEQAVAKIKEGMLEDQLKQPEQAQETSFVIDKGQEETVFIISEKSEKELLEKLYWQSLLAIIVGALLASGCIVGLIKMATIYF